MGLFTYFNRKNGQDSSGTNGASTFTNNETIELPEIPEKIFVERQIPSTRTDAGPKIDVQPPDEDHNIDLLFRFLDRNLESKGFDDALINPDATHLEENLYVIRNEVGRTIRRVRTFYEDFVREIDFHIGSRGRSGMIDTVDELTTKKQITESHIQQVLEIEAGAKNGTGDSQGLIMSYTRGFKNGLASISHHTVLNKKL